MPCPAFSAALGAVLASSSAFRPLISAFWGRFSSSQAPLGAASLCKAFWALSSPFPLFPRASGAVRGALRRGSALLAYWKA
eukprot:scaffold3747_cov240-Pinguiococcus_pyrenoidosus.AAC.15